MKIRTSDKKNDQNGSRQRREVKRVTYQEERIVAIQQSNLRQGKTKRITDKEREVSDLEGRTKRITDRDREKSDLDGRTTAATEN